MCNKRVLILANSDNGLYNFRRELLKELINPGSYLTERKDLPMDVYIAVPKGTRVSDLQEMGCHYIQISLKRHGKNPFQEIKLRNQYKKIISEVKPDIVFSYTIKPNIYGGMVCKELKVPCIMNITGLGTAIESDGLMQKFMLMLYKFALPGAKKVFFQNSENERFFTDHKLALGKHEILPGSGVNLEAFSYLPYPKEEGKIIFLSVMRIMKDKGIKELLACAKEIKSRYDNAEFHIIGSYDEEKYRIEVEEAEKLGFVRFLGRQNDMRSQYKKYHCIINPSYHEGMSNVLLEAAACGRPVIASNVPGCAETFDEGVSGFGFEVKNTDALISCVEKFLVLSLKERIQMGLAGRKKVEREFDRQIVVSRYIKELHN